MAVMNRGRTFEEKRKFISEGLSICAQVSVNVFRRLILFFYTAYYQYGFDGRLG